MRASIPFRAPRLRPTCAARALAAVPAHGTVLVRSTSGPPLPAAQTAACLAAHGAAQAAAFWPAAAGSGAGRWAMKSRNLTCSPAARSGAQGGAETRDGSDDGALRRLKGDCSRTMGA